MITCCKVSVGLCGISSTVLKYSKIKRTYKTIGSGIYRCIWIIIIKDRCMVGKGDIIIIGSTVLSYINIAAIYGSIDDSIGGDCPIPYCRCWIEYRHTNVIKDK